MDHTRELQVDLLSIDDIRAKLPEARIIYKAKQDALAAMTRDVQDFGGILAWMAHMAGESTFPFMLPRPPEREGVASGESVGAPTITAAKGKNSPAQDRAIAGLKRAGQPMGPTALYRFMQSQDLQVPTDANALGAALWNASKNARIKKTPDGLYALLEWETDQPQLQDSEPSENGASEPLSTAAQPQEGT